MNYLDIISSQFPDTVVISNGNPDNYDDLTYLSGYPIPSKEILDATRLRLFRAKKVEEISQSCEDQITSGFVSAALGSPHMYDSQPVDQINILGATAATAPNAAYPEGLLFPYAVRPMINGVAGPKEYKIHTHAQLRQAILDGAQYKGGLLIKFNGLRDYILNKAATCQDVESVKWV